MSTSSSRYNAALRDSNSSDSGNPRSPSRSAVSSTSVILSAKQHPSKAWINDEDSDSDESLFPSRFDQRQQNEEESGGLRRERTHEDAIRWMLQNEKLEDDDGDEAKSVRSITGKVERIEQLAKTRQSWKKALGKLRQDVSMDFSARQVDKKERRRQKHDADEDSSEELIQLGFRRRFPSESF